MAATRFALLSLLVASGEASVSESSVQANPVRKVVQMLSAMQKKVAAE